MYFFYMSIILLYYTIQETLFVNTLFSDQHFGLIRSKRKKPTDHIVEILLVSCRKY